MDRWITATKPKKDDHCIVCMQTNCTQTDSSDPRCSSRIWSIDGQSKVGLAQCFNCGWYLCFYHWTKGLDDGAKKIDFHTIDQCQACLSNE